MPDLHGHLLRAQVRRQLPSQVLQELHRHVHQENVSARNSPDSHI